MARIGGFFEDNVLVVDPIGKKYIIYNRNGKYLNEYRFPKFIRTSVNSIITNSGKMLLLGFGPEDSFGVTYQLNKDMSIDIKSEKKLGFYNNIPKLINCKNNPLLKQGPIYSNNHGDIYLTFQFASIILGFGNDNKLIFLTDKPENIDIPKNDSKNNEFRAPDLKTNPEVNVGLTGDSQFLYVIYSGTWLKTFWQLMTKKDELLSGRILKVYDKKTTKILNTINLGESISDIVADGEYLYLLSVDEEPQIKIIKKPN